MLKFQFQRRTSLPDEFSILILFRPLSSPDLLLVWFSRGSLNARAKRSRVYVFDYDIASHSCWYVCVQMCACVREPACPRVSTMITTFSNAFLLLKHIRIAFCVWHRLCDCDFSEYSFACFHFLLSSHSTPSTLVAFSRCLIPLSPVI